MKKVMVCGCGAQGSTICRRLDEEPNIEEVVCADYNLAAAEAVCKLMKKGTPKQVNAAHVDEIVPFDWVLKHIPMPPKDPEVIKAIIDEGIVEDNGAFVCEAYGKKDGKDIMVDLHVSSPGLEEAYERAKMTGEMYLTGQGAFLYTKLLVNDMVPQKGLISSDMLDDQQVEQYIAWANDLGITYTIDIKEGCKFDG